MVAGTAAQAAEGGESVHGVSDLPGGAAAVPARPEEYLALIDSIALLHQHQRELKRATREEVEIEYVEVTIEDIALANELAQDVLARALDSYAINTFYSSNGATQASRTSSAGAAPRPPSAA